MPLVGNVSGRGLARIGASFGTQSLPIIGSFGHLASHPNENTFQKASDIIFGIADVVPFAGDAISALKKPIETGIETIAPRTISPQILSYLHGEISPRVIVPRVQNFLTSVSKDIRFVAPIDKLPSDLHGILDGVAKAVRNDLKVAGVAVDEDPVHVIAQDTNGILHDIALTKDGKLLHYVEDFVGGGAKKIGEDIIQGGEDLFKTIRGGIDHIIPFHVKLANFFRSGRLLTTLAGLGIGLSILGGATTSGSTTASSTGTSTTSGTNNLPPIVSPPNNLTNPYPGTVYYPPYSTNQQGTTHIGQLNAGNVLQSQLQALSQSPSVSTAGSSPTTTSSTATSSTTTSQSSGSGIFSLLKNPIFLIAIVFIIILIIIIAVTR